MRSLTRLTCAVAVTACTGPVDQADQHETDVSAASRWPTYEEKDALGDPDPSSIHPSTGSAVPRLRTVDQFGEDVDLYDFAGSEAPIVFQMVYPELERSMELGRLLTDGSGPLADGPLGSLREAVDDGDLLYVRVLSVKSLTTGGIATDEDLARWDSQYPADTSPLLLDQEAAYFKYVGRYWVNENKTAELPELVRVRPSTMTVDREPDRHLGILQELLDP